MIDKRGGLALPLMEWRIISMSWQQTAARQIAVDVIRDLKAGATGWMHDVFPALEDFACRKDTAVHR